MHTIETVDIGKRFGSHIALDSVNLTLEAGSRVVLLGPSGAGKTTLLRILAGLETPDQGTVMIAGQDMLGKPPTARSLAMVSQDYALYPQLTVHRNLKTALLRFHLDRHAVASRIDETLRWFEIFELAERLPSQLSGGEAQRAALAKALVTRPKILLLDEPLSQVDGILKAPLTELVRDITTQYDCSTVIVTHDPFDAMRMADTVAILDQGRLIQHGLPSEVYRSPKTRVAARLLSPLGMNWFDLHAGDKQLVSRFESIHADDRATSQQTRFVGFRPEDFVWHPDGRQPEGRFTMEIEAHISRIQYLGFAQLVLADWQGHRLRLLADNAIDLGSSTACGSIAADRLVWVEH